MDLPNLRLGQTCEDMIQAYYTYYHTFYIEMVRMSNLALPSYIEKYFDTLSKLCKSLLPKEKMRAAIGIISLHTFGYRNFSRLSSLFDRILPQYNIEYVKFTSWCTGILIAHPNDEQIRYVNHLFNRCIGWICAYGRRARHCAAIHMLKTLFQNAGNTLIVFLPQIEGLIFDIIRFSSIDLLKDSADMLLSFTKAIIQYGRHYLKDYLQFMTNLIANLLNISDENENKKITALILLYNFIGCEKNFFLTYYNNQNGILNIFENFVYYDPNYSQTIQPASIRSCAFSVIARASSIDPALFMDYFYQNFLSECQPPEAGIIQLFLEQGSSLISEYPKETTLAFLELFSTFPTGIRNNINLIKSTAQKIYDTKDYDSVLLYGTKLLELQRDFPFSDTLLLDLVKNSTLSLAFKEFILRLFFSSYQFPDVIDNLFKKIQKILSELLKTTFQEKISKINSLSRSFSSHLDDMNSLNNDGKQLFSLETEVNQFRKKAQISLQLIASLPQDLLQQQQQLLAYLPKLATSEDPDIRKEIPPALYHLTLATNYMTKKQITKKLLKMAVFDQHLHVRYAYLEVVEKNCDEFLAEDKFLNYFQIFINDDAYTVRLVTLRILTKLAKFNPVFVTSITRHAILDYFFILKHVSSIRQRARISSLLPDLISASSLTIKAYSKKFLDIFIETLNAKSHEGAYILNDSSIFMNFIEQNSQNKLIDGLIQSLCRLAPYDPDAISQRSDVIIPLLCSYLKPNEDRSIVLSILQAFYVLLTPPASTLQIRTNTPKILETCSSFLATTQSRKIRIFILKVIGAIGVLKVFKMSPVITNQAPEIIDESTLRQFYHPLADVIQIDDSILIGTPSSSDVNLYYLTVVASELLKILQDPTLSDLYTNCVSALVQILSTPRQDALPFFDSFIDHLLTMMEVKNNENLLSFLPYYSQLVKSSGLNTIPFVSRSLHLIYDHFSEETAIQCLDLILSFLSSLREGFSPYYPDIICLLISTLDSYKTSHIELCKRILEAFNYLGKYASDYRYLIVPQICDAIVCEQTLPGVRILAINTLTFLLNEIELFNYIGPIMRSLFYGLDCQDQKIKDASTQLLYSILSSKSSSFLLSTQRNVNYYDVQPGSSNFQLDDDIDVDVSIDWQMSAKHRQIIFDAEKALKEKTVSIINDVKSNSHIQQKIFQFSDDSIISKIITPNLGIEKYMSIWLRGFANAIISNSPSDIIRVCGQLAQSYSPLSKALFKIGFHSCWKSLKSFNRDFITNTFTDLLSSSEDFSTAAHEILALLVFMDKIKQPVDIPCSILFSACLKYGAISFGLQIAQRLHEEAPNYKTVDQLMTILVKLGDWPNAVAIWKSWKDKTKTNVKLLDYAKKLTQLKLWEEAEEIFSTIYNSNTSTNNKIQALEGLMESETALAKWNEIADHFKDFENIADKLPRQQIALYLAESAFHLGHWDNLDKIIPSLPSDNLRSYSLSAINAIHQNNYSSLIQILETGFSLLASSPSTFWGENNKIHEDTMLAAQEFIEIGEMAQWLQESPNIERNDLSNNNLSFNQFSGDIIFNSSINNAFDVSPPSLLTIKFSNNNLKKHDLMSKTNIQKTIEDVWRDRLMITPRDFDLWFRIIGNKSQIVKIEDDSLIQFFDLQSISLGTKIHKNAFDLIFPDYNPNQATDLQKVCKIIATYRTGKVENAIFSLGNLLPKLSNEVLKQRCKLFYVTWLLETDDSLNNIKLAYETLKKDKIIQHFSDSSKSDSLNSIITPLFNDANLPTTPFGDTPLSPFNNHSRIRSSSCIEIPVQHLILPNEIKKQLSQDIHRIELLRKWAEINISLLNAYSEKSSTNHSSLSQQTKKDAFNHLWIHDALIALIHCCQEAPSFPDIVQLLNLFFDYGNILASNILKQIQKLPARLLLKASPQILVQLSHPSPEVSKFVHDLVFILLKEHYHALIFSLFVLSSSENQDRANAAKKILDEFKSQSSEIYHEIELIRESFLKTAVTLYEKISHTLDDALASFESNKIKEMVSILQTINIISDPTSDLEKQFNVDFSQNINQLKNDLASACCVSNFSQESFSHIYRTTESFYREISNKLQSIKLIQLSTISTELCEKTHYHIAVPGTYKPGKPIICIEYIVGQCKVLMSKQKPKDIVIKGEDGNFYQYLLKGHEDLRLDERIIQFFKLVNSFLKKDSTLQTYLLQTMEVIPLSIQHGLVQWVAETSTLSDMIMTYRKKISPDSDPMIETSKLEEYSIPFNIGQKTLLPIQKMALILKIFREVPDNDLADYMWMKAPSAEVWQKQVQTFTISTAINSIVGYIIGLGDRHPSNILVNKNTGKVVHIDFGDCFEKDMKRKLFPEVVPFRLTRMIVKAMGINGVDGLFMDSFVRMGKLLRENKRVLLMILAVFVQEPFIDSENKQSSNSMRSRVKQKLNGSDFEPKVHLSVEDQATNLINEATNIYNLSKMYKGWYPFW